MDVHEGGSGLTLMFRMTQLLAIDNACLRGRRIVSVGSITDGQSFLPTLAHKTLTLSYLSYRYHFSAFSANFLCPGIATVIALLFGMYLCNPLLFFWDFFQLSQVHFSLLFIARTVCNNMNLVFALGDAGTLELVIVYVYHFNYSSMFSKAKMSPVLRLTFSFVPPSTGPWYAYAGTLLEPY